jgi:YrbI family 3-deoxy-D-manno-octulosonate 8-phosphate phosphatase
VKKYNVVILDVDGTLTDGTIYISPEGEAMKAFNAKDGYGIRHILPQLGITPVIVTGRESLIVQHRARELGISEVYQNIADKAAKLDELAARYGYGLESFAYIGDDLNDYEAMKQCGFKACPADAVAGIKAIADYIAPHCGGYGAVRDVCEELARLFKQPALETFTHADRSCEEYMPVEKVKGYLAHWQRDGDVIESAHSTATVAEAAAALGVEEARIAKSLSLRGKEAVFVVVCAGDSKIDNRKYKNTFGVKAKMLSLAETLAETGYMAGGVCPFALPPGVEVYLDESLRRFATVFPACGSANSAIELSCEELAEYSGCKRWVDVCTGVD